MTLIKPDSPLTRETAFIDHGKPLLVTLHPRHMEMRFKGTRQRYTLAYDAALWLAARRVAEERMREKAALRRKAK